MRAIDTSAWLLTIFLMTMAGAEARALDVTEGKRPNTILFMADDLGYGELGSYGQQKIKTPHIDRLAAEGMRFTQYHSGSPVCAPSRCVLLTGRHPARAYIRNNFAVKKEGERQGELPIPNSELTLAEMLKPAGYATGCFGKWGLGYPGSEGDPLTQGFDRFYGYNSQGHAHNYYPSYLWSDREKVLLEGNSDGVTGAQYAPDLIQREALTFIRQNKDKPFFLYYAQIIPHLALQVPDDSLAEYAGKWDETPYDGKGESYQPHPTPKAAYAAMITRMDSYVGQTSELLRELGLDDNTVFIFTSDNGPTHLNRQVDVEFFDSAGGLRGLKGSVYEGGVRVPMIVRWPGRVAPGTASDHIAAHHDMMPTLAQIAGVEVPSQTDGLSFLPTLRGRDEAQPEHEFLIWDFGGYGGQLAVRLGDWKAVRRDLRKKPDSPWELYNLSHDPAEQNDVASAHPRIVERIDRIVREQRTIPEFEAFRFGPYAQQ